MFLALMLTMAAPPCPCGDTCDCGPGCLCGRTQLISHVAPPATDSDVAAALALAKAARERVTAVEKDVAVLKQQVAELMAFKATPKVAAVPKVKAVAVLTAGETETQYAEFLSRVLADPANKSKRVLYVGGEPPLAANANKLWVPSGFHGVADGVYDCYCDAAGNAMFRMRPAMPPAKKVGSAPGDVVPPHHHAHYILDAKGQVVGVMEHDNSNRGNVAAHIGLDDHRIAEAGQRIPGLPASTTATFQTNHGPSTIGTGRLLSNFRGQVFSGGCPSGGCPSR